MAAISALLLIAAASNAVSKGSGSIYISAKSAIIIDARTKKILYAKNTNLRIPPASTAKVMTALLVLEKINLDKMITVSKKAADVEPSKAGLKRGVQYRAGDLLAACLMASSNDASIALAEEVAGSESEFVKLMNEKAEKSGMKNTCFVNATGLPSKKIKQYSTVFDLAQMMRHALSEPKIVELMNTKEKVITGANGKKIRLRNHNKMLWKKPKAVIGKTGYTMKSRHCFTGAAFSGGRRKIIFAVLSSRKLWQDLSILVNYGLYKSKR
ncbi:MAG: D-alanyl-D-alanine carboxypeptidase family protein [Candidatus Omnitrophota bacterium]|nr:D-alanyl-D-alanine carboxypeptidase family protein [Candidatus Omnitrophota bacterium]